MLAGLTVLAFALWMVASLRCNALNKCSHENFYEKDLADGDALGERGCVTKTS
jgi:hypothetical protein